MRQQAESEKRRGHLFNVDILIEETTNGKALELLLNLLNTPQVTDYRVINGIELGRIIDASVQDGKKSKGPAKAAPDGAPQAAKSNIVDTIETFKQKGTLVRITVMKGLGVKLSMPCRILNYDVTLDTFSIYHVDEKKVYTFGLNEIDEISAS